MNWATFHLAKERDALRSCTKWKIFHKQEGGAKLLAKEKVYFRPGVCLIQGRRKSWFLS